MTEQSRNSEERYARRKEGGGEARNDTLEERRCSTMNMGMYLLRSDTSNWLWNVSSHITAILMSWPAESIVEKISLSIVDICIYLLNR